MTKTEREHRYRVIEQCQCDANTPKERLMELMGMLYEAGASRKARSLETIIEHLEKWQNT